MTHPLKYSQKTLRAEVRQQYDCELGCFVQTVPGEGDEEGQRYVAFCLQVPAFGDDGDIFVRRLTALLASLSSDRQFFGVVLRFCVCATPSIGGFANDQLAKTAMLDNGPNAHRRAILKRRAQSDAGYLTRSRTTQDSACRVNNYDFYIYGAIPIGPLGPDYARMVLQELNERVICYLNGARKWGARLNRESYLERTNTILKVLVDSDLEDGDDPKNEGRAFVNTKAFGLTLQPMLAEQHLPELNDRQSSLFNSWNWMMGREESRPGFFMLTTTYRVVGPENRQQVIRKELNSLMAMTYVNVGINHSRLNRKIAYKKHLANAAEQGESMVLVDVGVYGMGETEEAARHEARRFIQFMREHGFEGECRYSGKVAAETALPMALKARGANLATLMTIERAVRFAPAMGAKVQTKGDGLVLLTHLGQPTLFDFMSMESTPLTIICGEAGSGKGWMVDAMAMHCLSRRMPVFAITDNTFDRIRVEQLGGQYGESQTSTRAAKTKLYPFNLKQNEDITVVVDLAFSYISAVASLFGAIPDEEKVIAKQWLTEYCKQVIENSESDIGVSISSILEAMNASGIEAPALVRGLTPFGETAKYGHIASITWDSDLTRDEFTVMVGDSDVEKPLQVVIAGYLTKMALGLNLYSRQDKSSPAALILEDIALLLSSTAEVSEFVQKLITHSNRSNCAVITTLSDVELLQKTSLGQWMAAAAEHLVNLQQRIENVEKASFRKMFGLTPEIDCMYRNIRTRRNKYSEMIIHSRGHVGIYRLALSPFAKVMTEHRRLWQIASRLEEGDSYLLVLESEVTPTPASLEVA